MQRMIAMLTLTLAVLAASPAAHAQERVTFPSNDGKTTLTGYLFCRRAAPPRDACQQS